MKWIHPQPSKHESWSCLQGRYERIRFSVRYTHTESLINTFQNCNDQTTIDFNLNVKYLYENNDKYKLHTSIYADWLHLVIFFIYFFFSQFPQRETFFATSRFLHCRPLLYWKGIYSKTCVREPPLTLTSNSGWCGKGVCLIKVRHVILLAKLHDLYLYKAATFPHQPHLSQS